MEWWVDDAQRWLFAPFINKGDGLIFGLVLLRFNLSNIYYDRHICQKSCHYTGAGRKKRHIFKRDLVQIRDGLPHGTDVFMVDQTVQEIVVQLRDDRRRYVRRALARNCEKHSEFPAFLDDLLKCFESVILPLSALPLRLLG